MTDNKLLAADPVERIAIALYEASGGDLNAFPWPCKKADHYRRLARVSLNSPGVAHPAIQ